MNRSVLIYDHRCGLCRASVERIKRSLIRGDALEFMGCETEERTRRFPQVATPDCLQAMTLISADGTVSAGVDAAPDILRHMRGWRFLAPLLRFRPLRSALRPLYRFIADHRRRDNT